jgi:hypothetical protein
MKVRRVAVLLLVVLAAVAAVGQQAPAAAGGEPTPTGETTENVVYVVIVPPEPGKTQCRIVPDPRKMEATQSLVFVNLSDQTIKFKLPTELFGSAAENDFFLGGDKDSPRFPLVDPKPGEHIYSVRGSSGGCLTELPTPKIVIP